MNSDDVYHFSRQPTLSLCSNDTEQVVTVQSDPGGAGVGNVYRLGWKEECIDNADDTCEVNSRQRGMHI